MSDVIFSESLVNVQLSDTEKLKRAEEKLHNIRNIITDYLVEKKKEEDETIKNFKEVMKALETDTVSEYLKEKKLKIA